MAQSVGFFFMSLPGLKDPSTVKAVLPVPLENRIKSRECFVSRLGGASGFGFSSFERDAPADADREDGLERSSGLNGASFEIGADGFGVAMVSFHGVSERGGRSHHLKGRTYSFGMRTTPPP